MGLKQKITLIALTLMMLATFILTFVAINSIKELQKGIIQKTTQIITHQIKNSLKTYADIIIQNIDNFLQIYPLDPKVTIKKHTDILFNDYLIPIYDKYKNNKNIKKILLEIIKNTHYKITPFDKTLRGSFAVVDMNEKRVLTHWSDQCNNRSIYEIDKSIFNIINSLKYKFQAFSSFDCQGTKKYVFAKYFRPFNWVIFTCITKKDLYPIEEAIYENIKKIRFNDNDYFFGYKVVNNRFFYVFHPTLKGEMHPDKVKDIKGYYYKKDLIKAAMSGGGYVTYYFKNLTTNKIEKKLTYAVYYPKLDLIIAVGTYLTKIKSIISPMEAEIKKGILNSIVNTIALSAILLILSLIILNIVIKKIIISPIERIDKAVHTLVVGEIPEDIDAMVRDFENLRENIKMNLEDLINYLKGI